jgi:fumarate reductase flavoprotein subunit
MKQIQTDIAVVGLGPAGLAAAVQAAEAGMKVAAFEKGKTPGGAANMGAGLFAVESSIQKKYLIDLTKEEAFELFMDYTHWNSNARLVRDYFWKSADTIEWLMDMGVEFEQAGKFYSGSLPTWHKVKPDSGPSGPKSASKMTLKMTERARELGVDIYLETPVREIHKKDGAVSGITAVDSSGEEIHVESKAVIIATGGFGDNPEMIREFTGFTYGKDMFNFRIPGVVGDGLKMAWKAGAGRGVIDMETFAKPVIPDECFGFAAVFNQPNLLVNVKGERIMNEKYMENGAVLANCIKRQPRYLAYMILSEDIIRHYKRFGLDFPGLAATFFGNPMDFFDEHMEIIKETNPDGEYAVCDSVHELSQRLGINEKGLEETLREYNECCRKNYDDIFNKDRRYMREIKGRLYAARIALGAYGSLGGIRINHKTEVLDDDYEVIPGMYAAGTDVCDIYAGTYLYKLPGNTMGFAVNTGRIAGENAAAYVSSIGWE